MGDRQPYIGVTGLVTSEDVHKVTDAWNSMCHLAPGHRLMAGVLVSAKTLRGEATASRRYPPVGRVPGLVAACREAGLWPVLHYNTREIGTLGEQVDRLVATAGVVGGVQFNVVCPDLHALRRLRWAHGREVILQVNGGSVATLGEHRWAGRQYAGLYAGVASYALFDLSGGTGRPFSVAWAARELSADGAEGLWRLWGISPGVAGGLGPGCADALADLRTRIGSGLAGSLSVDAESGLRVPVDDPTPGEKHQDRLSAGKVRGYLGDVVKGLLGMEGDIALDDVRGG